jgi:hypothetical protein
MLLVTILLVLLKTMLQCTAASYERTFQLSCSSTEDYGWPRFETMEELASNEKWASYFNSVYGALPETYPVCVFDMEVLNRTAYVAAGLNGTRKIVTNTSTLQDGDLFVSMGVPGTYQIYHSAWKPIPNDTWVEVTHTVYPTEVQGMWVWRTRGSGIFYNTGNTLVFSTPAEQRKIHAEAIEFLSANCSKKPSSFWPQLESDVFGFCAREKGYDSIQFEPQQGEVPVGTFGLSGLTEIVLVNLNGDLNCGTDSPSDTSLRMGWRANERCACVNKAIAPSCGLMAFPPLPQSMVHPPLCAAQAANHSVPCNGFTCELTRCDSSQS